MDVMKIKGIELLIKTIVATDNENDCKALLDDLFTAKEMIDLSQRLLVAKMLSENAQYSQIEEETGASSATISRVNKCLVYGSDGYKNLLPKLK